MSLRELKIQEGYRSSSGNIVDEFYLPVLSESVEYSRAVGYFNSSSLAKAAKGITAFIENGGKMKLIASPQLDEKDIEAIKKGYADRENVIKEAVMRELSKVNNEIVQKRLEFLAWLVAEKLLDIRFALVENYHGIYHEKLGVLTDKKGNKIAFGGSSNETLGGIYSNFESIDVFRSWIEAEENRVKTKIQYFNDLWENKTNKLEIIEFSEAAKREIFEKFKTNSQPLLDPESSEYNSSDSSQVQSEGEGDYEYTIGIPGYIQLRDYQKKAITSWFKNKARGVLKMATGTGKTITALSAATTLREHIIKNDDQPLTIVVVCPYRHLVTQWDENAREFGYRPIKCFESRRTWNKKFNSAISNVNAEVKDDLFVITTNSTFSGNEFQRLLSNLNQPLLFIVDEVHNLGSKKMRNQLPKYAEFRLGLSATPERWYDEGGTKGLYEYFGKPVFEYGLKKAIEENHLTPYNYYPITVPLTDDELYEYLRISERITYLMADDEHDINDENGPLKILLLKRARITATAQNKLEYLKNELLDNNLTKSSHNLIYCGTGRVEMETEEEEEEIKQIKAATRLLGNKLGMLNSAYVAETDTAKRKNLLKNFANGDIQALVAIRCLDEGVDVPATRRAFILASSTNPRQFIQRRGRVLRKHEGKKLAEIWDFIVIPPADAIQGSSFNYERKLIEKELKRVIEFTKLARNGAQADRMLLDLKKQYNLLHI